MDDRPWKPRTVEDSVDAGVHPAVAAYRLNGGLQPQLDLDKLGIDPSRPDWGSDKKGTALVDALGFKRAAATDCPDWAKQGEDNIVLNSKKRKDRKEEKDENRDEKKDVRKDAKREDRKEGKKDDKKVDKKDKKKKKRDKKKTRDSKKKKKDSKKTESSSSSSKKPSSSSSSASKGKSKKTRKDKKERKKDEGAAAEEPACGALLQEGDGSKDSRADGNDVATKQLKLPAAGEEELRRPAATSDPPVIDDDPEASTPASSSSPFPPVLAALENKEMSVLSDAVRLLASGSHPVQQRAAIASALGNLVKGSADPTGINRIAVARAGAIPPLIQLLKSENSEGQLQAAWALHNLTSKNADNKEVVVKENGVSPLVTALRMGTAETKAQAIGALRNLSGGGLGCKAAIQASGAIPTTVALLAKGSSHPQVQANMAVVLYNLCKDSNDSKAAAFRAGALPVFVSLLGGGVQQVQQEAADVMRVIISGNSDYCSAMISAGVGPVLRQTTGPAAPARLRQQAGLLKKELVRCGGPDVQKALS